MSKKGPAIHSFIECVRAYLPTDRHVRERTNDGHPGAPASPATLKENRFYYFDDEARQAFCHAIEDLAMEEASGSLVSVVSGFKEFETHRERYQHLAATIDEVSVTGTGRLPKPVRHVAFQTTPKGNVRDFRLSSFAGARTHAAFICRRGVAAGDRSLPADLFIGFFTFNPRIASRVRAALVGSLAGPGTVPPEFDRLLALDQAARQLESDFARQKKAVEQAVERLQADGSVSSNGKLAIALEKGASQLAEWKNRFSTMLSELPGPLGS